MIAKIRKFWYNRWAKKHGVVKTIVPFWPTFRSKNLWRVSNVCPIQILQTVGNRNRAFFLLKQSFNFEAGSLDSGNGKKQHLSSHWMQCKLEKPISSDLIYGNFLQNGFWKIYSNNFEPAKRVYKNICDAPRADSEFLSNVIMDIE